MPEELPPRSQRLKGDGGSGPRRLSQCSRLEGATCDRCGAPGLSVEVATPQWGEESLWLEVSTGQASRAPADGQRRHRGL